MKTFLKLALFCGLLAIAIPASAQLHIGVGINIAPPAPRTERMTVRPSRDAVWIAGYHRWPRAVIATFGFQDNGGVHRGLILFG